MDEPVVIVAHYAPLGGVTLLQSTPPASIAIHAYRCPDGNVTHPGRERLAVRRVPLARAEATIARLLTTYPGATVQRVANGMRVQTFGEREG
jgi:hypothetical protein